MPETEKVLFGEQGIPSNTKNINAILAGFMKQRSLQCESGSTKQYESLFYFCNHDVGMGLEVRGD